MIKISLPDGSVREYAPGVTGADVAASIGSGLAKAALAVKIDGQQRDLSMPIHADAHLEILTLKTPEGLDVMRHTLAAQVLAKAIKELYPEARLAIGPTIEHGFYYDVDVPQVISSEDLPRIEERMRAIIASGAAIERKDFSREEALAAFEQRGESYKQAIINDTPVQPGEHFGMYHQAGTDFVDLCRGPHLPHLGLVGAFRLSHLAGAYWRGDSRNKMLTRIYGVAFATEKELKAYFFRLAEAERRDHRKLGRQLDLFHLQEEAPGQVFWHSKGWTIFLELQNYVRSKLRAQGYQEVNTPQLISSELYKQSGHWDKFGTGNMFLVEDPEKQRTYALKPMNCPCHVQIFNTGTKSYRDLPLRMSEFGTCKRNEAHGALHGLMRVASMTQDDAHIFCTPEQIEAEVVVLCRLIKDIYRELGFAEPFVKFSDRPEQRVGSDAIWDTAEEALRRACDAAGLTWKLNPGEGAFYGPKLEFVLQDAIGRDWQCGTVQLDFNLPERLGAEYVAEDGSKRHPVMIHRALLGSLERFTGVLIEHFVGHFPLWLAPVQLVLMGITEKQNAAVEALSARFFAAGIRVESDLRNEKINYKIREHSLQKVPYVGVVGDKEIADGTLTIRRFGSQQQMTLRVEDFLAQMQQDIASRALPPASEAH